MFYLYKITGGIVDRNQREGTAGSIRNAFHRTRIFHTRNGVSCYLHLIAHFDMRQLTFLVVCLNPTFILVNNTHQCLTRIDKLPSMYVFCADSTVASGNDVAIRKI